MVTILADNYFGYCKKEVKTQIGYSANLFGLAEEEHAGGALAFATFNLGDRFVPGSGADRERQPPLRRGARRCWATRATFHASGYATDAIYPEIHYMPEDMEIDVHAPGHQLDQRGQEQHLKLLPGRIYIHPERLQDPHGEAPRGAELAADRHGAGGRLLPQAVHGLGRRQIGDQQEPGRRVLPGSFYVRSFEDDMALVQRDLRPATTRTRACPSCAPATDARPHAPDPVARSLARLGDQAAHAQPRRVHPGVQRLAREHSQPRPRAGVRHQALLPAGVGRRLAQPLQRRHHQRRTGARAQVRGPAAGRELPADRAARRTAPGGPTSCGRISSRPTRCRWRTTSPPRWWCRPAGWSASRVSTTGTRASSWRRTASSGCSSAPTTRSIPGLDRQTEEDMAAPGSSARTFSRSPGRTRGGIVEDVAVHDAFTANRCASTSLGTPRAATPAISICSAEPRLDRRQAHQESALPAGAAGPRATRATATSRRWAPGSTAGCRCTRRCSSR